MQSGMVVSVISLALYLLHFHFLNFLEISRQVGNITTPLSMLVIGVNLSMIPFRSIFGNKNYIFSAFFRLLVFPLILWFLLRRSLWQIPIFNCGLSYSSNAGAAMMVNFGDGIQGECLFCIEIFSAFHLIICNYCSRGYLRSTKLCIMLRRIEIFQRTMAREG